MDFGFFTCSFVSSVVIIHLNLFNIKQSRKVIRRVKTFELDLDNVQKKIEVSKLCLSLKVFVTCYGVCMYFMNSGITLIL